MSEGIKVRATAQGFFGKLIERGEIFTIGTEEAFAGSWMERVGAGAKEAPPQALPFCIKHVGGGNYIVVKNDDDSRASVMFKKGAKGEAEGLAQAEANRLNAGGAMVLEAAPQQETEPKGDVNLPDA